MSLIDVIVGPIYFFIFLIWARWYSKKNYKGHPLQKYYVPGVLASLSGALLFGLIYEFRYGGGDTFWFFQGIEVMNTAFFTRPANAIELLFLTGGEYTYDPVTNGFANRIWWFRDDNSFTIIKLGGVFSVFTFGSYLGTAFFFAMFSFAGVWKLLKLFYGFVPDLIKQYAFAFLFLPSVVFWGSGIGKDAIMLGCFGVITYCFFQLVIYKQRKLKYIIGLLIFSFIMLKVRSFLFFILAPSLLLAWFLHATRNIENKAFRVVAMPFLLVMVVAASAGVLNFTSTVNERYTLDNLQKRAYDTQWWHTRVQELEGDQGSHYSLGAPTSSIEGMLANFPQAVNVTFFRPYVWEANNIVMLFSALESLVVLLFTLSVVFSVIKSPGGLKLLSNPYIGFALFFAIAYGFAVGVTSYNFGALVRYKIPSMPFFIAALFTLKYYAENRDKKLDVLDATE